VKCRDFFCATNNSVQFTQILLWATVREPPGTSRRALTKGFNAKGQEYVDTLKAFVQTALQYKAAYLAAGKQLTEADAANQAAIKYATQQLEGHA
jgi:hypothetical protein